MLCLRMWFILSAAVFSCCLLATVEGGPSEDLTALQDDFWAWRMKTLPTYATYYGINTYNDQVFNYSYGQFEVWKDKTREFLTRLETIDTDSLSRMDMVNHDILKDTLDTYIEGSQWDMYGSLSPLSFLGGLHLSSDPGMASTTTKEDFENYIARLNKVPQQVDDIIEMGRLAIALNRTLHNVSMLKVPGQFDYVLVDNASDASAFKRFDSLDNSDVPEVDRSALRETGLVAVEAFLTAYRTLKDFVVNEYMPNTRTEYGVYAWDPTGDYYRACLKWHLSFEMSAEDVHAKGLEEVDRIHKDMVKILEKLQFFGTVAEFFDSLQGNPAFYSNDTDKILKEYRNVVFNRINPVLNKFFRDIPDIPLEVEASSSDGIGGGYSSASDNSPGRFIINLFRPMEVPFFEMMALSLHEANPGHHMQHSYSMMATLPQFRKHDILSFYNPPNFFPFYSSYGEGWGLYSEYLGEEMGVYEDEYEMMGRYSYEILRAVRLVVDTGLHHYKWSRDRAISYMTNYTALAYASAANEIDRYITWPGQACAYKLGEIKMKELRRQAETELGSLFDIKEFHLLVLQNGAMPMRTLESMVDHWIADTKAAAASGAMGSRSGPTTSLIGVLIFSFVAMYRFYIGF